jgi:hypothetical protein
LLAGYQDEFTRAGSKDEVDNTETRLANNLRNNFSFRMNLLEGIVETHGLGDLPRVENMRSSYNKDYDRLSARIGQLADKRKAQLDREAAGAARAVLDEAKARVTAAGTEIAKAEQLRLMTIDDLSKETDADKKTTLSAKIKEYEASIKLQEVVKKDAEKEVTRLKEANDNAEKLATIAEELASAKESTDLIIQDIQDGMDELLVSIHEGEEYLLTSQFQSETMLFEAD